MGQVIKFLGQSGKQNTSKQWSSITKVHVESHLHSKGSHRNTTRTVFPFLSFWNLANRSLSAWAIDGGYIYSNLFYLLFFTFDGGYIYSDLFYLLSSFEAIVHPCLSNLFPFIKCHMVTFTNTSSDWNCTIKRHFMSKSHWANKASKIIIYKKKDFL